MPTALTLLRLLSDGAVHSGTALGQAIGVSRAAVWKQLQQLQHYGVSCHAVPGLGYQLATPCHLIDESSLREQWRSSLPETDIDLHYFLSIDSTNTFLLRQPLRHSAQVLVAVTEFQTAGRGRRGRQWQSPFAANIYLSLKREFHCGLEGLSGLSLAVGVAIAETLQSFCAVPIQLKWPNDIRAQQRKLGGVLIELSGEAGGPCQVVIGLGINVHMQQAQAQAVDQAWVSVEQLSAASVSRTTLIEQLVVNLLRVSDAFEQFGFQSFCERFNQRDEFRGQPVFISGVNETIEGIEAGVDEQGSLLLDTPHGRRKIIAGEVSLRAQR